MARQMWSVKEMHALIAAVRGNPSLYDRRDSDYGRAKDDIWQRISTVPEIRDKNAEQCKLKWKTLRIQLRRIYVAKVKNNQKRSKVRWNCYDKLKFLIPHMDSIATDDTKKVPELEVLSDTCEDDDNEDCDSEANGGAESDDSFAAPPFQSPSIADLPASAQADSTDTTRKTATHNNVFKIENETNPSMGPFYQQNSSIQLRNEIDPNTPLLSTNPSNYFLMDIGMQMDRLNVIAQMEIKIEIHRLLLEKLRDPCNLR